MTQTQRLLYTFFCSSIFLLIGTEVVESSSHHLHDAQHNITKLFVFGDSYADTGNSNKSGNGAWKEPYGITFPGKPSGRASDGLLFTDLLAKFLGLESPIPYEQRNTCRGKNCTKYGMNFAFGGTGVLDLAASPNMTTQIDYFEQLIKNSTFTPLDLQNSLVHISCVGNDYIAYLNKNDTQILKFVKYIGQVVNQLMVNIQRIQSFGLKKISVSGLHPVGCLPFIVDYSPNKTCNDLFNHGADVHNYLLHTKVSDLNKKTNDNGSTIVILEFYNAFDSAFKEFPKPYEACCPGINKTSYCGLVENGKKLYTLCEDRRSYLFWDGIHPSQAGWEALMPLIKANLTKLLH